MADTFARLKQRRLDEAVAELLQPRLEETLSRRQRGHCMRVTDLADHVMEVLCARLGGTHDDAAVYILGSHDDDGLPYRITSTKLVELRNPDAEGGLRPPLLVFVPTMLRTSAEDSFGVATFEDLSFPAVYKDLVASLSAQVPPTLRAAVENALRVLVEEAWQFADDVAKARYLLSALSNGIDGETLGASLYELGLIPDFKLFADPTSTGTRIKRNLTCVRALMESSQSVRGRIGDLGLADEALATRLGTFFERYDIQEPESWAPVITSDRSWWTISFDKWQFRDQHVLGHVTFVSVATDLPAVASDEQDRQLATLAGQQVLAPNSRRKMNVTFEVAQPPSRITGLDHFTLQLLAQDGTPVGKAKKVKAWSQNRVQAATTLTRLERLAFDEGWHVVRVVPRTAEGDPLPVALSDGSAHPNESEPFYVMPGAKIEEDPPQRAVPKDQSVEHARFRLQLVALADQRDPGDLHLSTVSWADRNPTRTSASQDTLIARFGAEGASQIPLPHMLKVAEQRILEQPTTLSSWRMLVKTGTAEPPAATKLDLPASSVMASFLAAREAFFELVRGGSDELTVQAMSLREHLDSCTSYAQAYLDLLRALLRQAETTSGGQRQQRLKELRSILAVDSVHVVLVDFRGRLREAALVAPTHPLRALWAGAWARQGQIWIEKTHDSGTTVNVPFVRSALHRLTPSAFPVAVPVENGRVFTSVDDLTSQWAIYAPTTEDNSRGLVADICAALGLKEPSAAGSDISGGVIASKIQRYLAQHPYVRELSVNVFNPGAASIVADAMESLQRAPEYARLRYDVRLFAPDPDSPVLGESLDSLLRPDSTTSEAEDVFAAPTGSHLFPKLRIAKHAVSEFRADPAAFTAHLSILLDVFPAEDLSTADKPTGAIPVGGLIQDFATAYVDDESGTYWTKWPIVGKPVRVADDSAAELLASLTGAVTHATAAVASGGSRFSAVPVVTLGLDAEARQLLYEVHQVSDWVFTVDRNMGIEFFDHGGLKARPDYLIDYVPGAAAQTTHNLIVSSRSHDELEAMLRPVLTSFGLAADSDQAVAILTGLRSLSGQLALKLISSPTQQAEALGLALARLYLAYQGALGDQVIVPLDAHTDLYRAENEPGDGTEPASLQRTDLALFDLNLGARTITCNLVEVKCYSQVGDLAAFNQLKERIAGQIEQSERVIQRHFDPNSLTVDRPDRPLKSRELAQILRFYMGRSVRYGIFDGVAAQEAEAFLASIEDGYSLQFRRSALIFDFEKSGTDTDHEVGIEYHRIGKDLVAALLEACRKPSVTAEAAPGTQQLSEQFIPSLPKLESAAFITPRRDRTASWTTEDGWGTSVSSGTDEPPNGPAPFGGGDVTAEPPEPGDHRPDGRSEPPADTLGRDGQASGAETPLIERTNAGEPGAASAAVDYSVILGVNGDSPQFGVLGEVAGRRVAIDLNSTHTISLFGVQGGGKSYTLGSVIEMATMPIPNVNVLPSPLATVIFHYSPTQDYPPEFTSMIRPNGAAGEVRVLRDHYHADSDSLKDVLLLTSKDKVAERRAEFPGLAVQPIAFAATELKAAHWKFLMGAVGSQSMYMKQMNLIMRGLRDNLTLAGLKAGIDNSGLTDPLKNLAHTRLMFAEEYIDDHASLQDLIRPGRLIIVDLRDEYIEKDEALGLFVVLLQIFSEAMHEGRPFNKLVVFDEAHKYIENAELIASLVEVVREMRHKGTSIMIASQDPPSVPTSLIELSSQIILHRFNSPAWLKHIQKANTALNGLTAERMGHLGTGEAYVWSGKASDDAFSTGAIKVKLRPRVTEHGGSTRTAVT